MKRTIHDTPQRVSYDGQFGTVTGYAGYLGGRRELQPDVIYDVEWMNGSREEIAGAHLTEVSEGAYAAEYADLALWRASHAETEAPEGSPVVELARLVLDMHSRKRPTLPNGRPVDWSELGRAAELARHVATKVAALERAARCLVDIYARSAGSIDWSELDHAHELAALALEVGR